MTYALAIFDFDGTLADTFPFFLSVFNRIADKHGFSRIDLAKVDGLRHYSTREMMRHVKMPAWKLPLASKSFMDLMKGNVDGIALFDGIGDALRDLSHNGVQLAVVSSNAEHNVRKVLGEELAGLFGQFECGMSIFGKASRIRAVLKNAGAAAGDAIYIGDQGTDAEAAQKVKVAFGAVHWGTRRLRRCAGMGRWWSLRRRGRWWGLGGLSARRPPEFHTELAVRAERLRMLSRGPGVRRDDGLYFGNVADCAWEAQRGGASR